MRRRLFLISASVLLVLGSGCQKQEPPKYQLTSTVTEIMGAMVMPSADALWNAVSTTITDKGTEEKAPKTAQEWKDVRNRALTLMEASNLILIPGRRVGVPVDTPLDQKIFMTPEQIEALIAQEPDSWTKMSQAMHDSVLPALKAIDAKDAMALSDAGEAIDKACETCHHKFWYPNDAKKN